MPMIMQNLGRMSPGVDPDIDKYLESYDPEAFDGRGQVTWTSDISKAKRFVDATALFEEWKRVPVCHPIRLSDGKPNRPLTAYSITTIPVEV